MPGKGTHGLTSTGFSNNPRRVFTVLSGVLNFQFDNDSSFWTRNPRIDCSEYDDRGQGTRPNLTGSLECVTSLKS